MRAFPSEKLSLTEGSEVEVSYKKNNFEKVWYRAIIEAEPPGKPKSRSRDLRVRLFKDDFATPLTQLTHRVSFRPIPPEDMQARIDIVEGTVVDAHHKHGWWTGLVVKQIGDDKCFVFLDSPPDIIQFERKHLRPHVDWVDEKWWEIPGRNVRLLRRLTEESVFSSGTMVEVSTTSKMYEGEVVWILAMIIKEIEEEDDDEKKYIVKLCDHPLSCEDKYARPSITVDLRSVRPRQPPFSVGEYQSAEYVEVFHYTSWRQGRVKGIIGHDWCKVVLEATNKELSFKLSDIRPSKAWEDGIGRLLKDETAISPKEPLLTQELVNEMGDSVMNAKESGPPVTPSPGTTATPLKQTQAKTQRKTFPTGSDSTGENETSKDNNRKRKREENLSSYSVAEENEANNVRIYQFEVLPFEKNLPTWKTFESMEVFKTFPQNPHFIPLVETREDSREMSAVGMMLTFSALLKEVKDLRPDDPVSSLKSLKSSFAELKKHGFDVKVPELRISKLLSLREKQAKKRVELKGAEKLTAEKESIKVENERKILLELQRLNEEADKEIAHRKSCEATIVQQLKDVELQFQTTASAPW